MLNCAHCRLSTVQAVFGISQHAGRGLILLPRHRAWTAGRAYSVTVLDKKTLEKGNHDQARQIRDTGSIAVSKRVLSAGSKLPHAGPKALVKKMPKADIDKHLMYLTDPVKLADFVLKKCGSPQEFENAAEVVRAASKYMDCVVSWNHMINYHMQQGKLNLAIKLYNEVGSLHLKIRIIFKQNNR